MSDGGRAGTSSAAKRRRETRLRAAWRHEQLSVRMALAAAQHHSAPKCAGPETHVAPRGQTKARAAAGAQHFSLDLDEAPAAGGSRPDRLTEVRPQDRVQRHTVEQIILAPMLDAPAPLMEEQLLVDVFAPHDIQVPEQVIEVPKIRIDELSVRTPVREPQLAEQLVEVPTIISFSSLQRVVEQNVDIPVRVVVCGVLLVFTQNTVQRRFPL